MADITLSGKQLIYKDTYRGYLIYENSADITHIFYEVKAADNEKSEDVSRYVFDTIELCKKFIDKILN